MFKPCVIVGIVLCAAGAAQGVTIEFHLAGSDPRGFFGVLSGSASRGGSQVDTVSVNNDGGVMGSFGGSASTTGGLDDAGSSFVIAHSESSMSFTTDGSQHVTVAGSRNGFFHADNPGTPQNEAYTGGITGIVSNNTQWVLLVYGNDIPAQGLPFVLTLPNTSLMTTSIAAFSPSTPIPAPDGGANLVAGSLAGDRITRGVYRINSFVSCNVSPEVPLLNGTTQWTLTIPAPPVAGIALAGALLIRRRR